MRPKWGIKINCPNQRSVIPGAFRFSDRMGIISTKVPSSSTHHCVHITARCKTHKSRVNAFCESQSNIFFASNLLHHVRHMSHSFSLSRLTELCFWPTSAHSAYVGAQRTQHDTRIRPPASIWWVRPLSLLGGGGGGETSMHNVRAWWMVDGKMINDVKLDEFFTLDLSISTQR